MEKIFYTTKPDLTTKLVLNKILSKWYDKNDAEIFRTEHGKPYVKDGPFFSVTHTCGRLYIAFSDREIGLDAESLQRKPRYTSIVKKFPPAEQAEIRCAEDFLKHWVVKESAVKYMGGTLAADLSKLQYVNGMLTYQDEEFPAKIALLRHEEFILSVCGNGRFDNPLFIEVV